MCILDLSKVLMCEFHYDYIKINVVAIQDSYSLILIVSCMKLHQDKEMFDFRNYSAKTKFCNDSNKLFAGKLKHETGGVTIEEFVGLKPRIHSFLVDDSREHKKGKSANKILIEKTSHNEHKDIC